MCRNTQKKNRETFLLYLRGEVRHFLFRKFKLGRPTNRNVLLRFRFGFLLRKSFSFDSDSSSSSESGQYLAQFVNSKNFYKIFPFQCQKQHYFQESWILCWIRIQIRTGTRTVMRSGSAKAKSYRYGSCGSGSCSTTLTDGRKLFFYIRF